MAKTSTERMREKKERDEKERRALEDSTYPFLKVPFSEWLKTENGYMEFEGPFGFIGIEPPRFEDERGPEEFMVLGASEDEDPFLGAKGAVGRAEVIIDYMLDAVWALANALNSYKREEIEARLSELESSDEIDKATAMKEAIKLNKILDQLDKQVRWSFRQWKVTGI